MFPTNRQNFLTELSSLLSFMQEDDRKAALSMYNKMFDGAPDEQELLNYLVSPTRQAVKLARVYDPSVSSGGGSAEFIDEISSIQSAGGIQGGTEVPSSGAQASERCSHPDEPGAAKPARRRQAWKDDSFQTQTCEINKPAAPSKEHDVDDFISGIRIRDDITVAEEVRNSSPDTLSRDFPVADSKPAAESEAPAPAASDSGKSGGGSAEDDSAKVTESKTNVPLLILYTIFAIPITSFIIVLVILFSLNFLGLSCLSGYLGYLFISSAFGGFAVFADVMVVLGASLVLIALAILFIWIFVWLLGGVIVAVVKGAIKLGGGLCTREVES